MRFSRLDCQGGDFAPLPPVGYGYDILFCIQQALHTSGESRIIFLPERSSICQYRPEISAIIVKTQSRARLVLAQPVLYIVKTQKMYCTNILKTTISKSTNKRYRLRSTP